MMTARQSMNLSQVYGNSAIGTSPAVNKKQKTNLAVATGVMGKGSSRTPSDRMDLWLRCPAGHQ